MWYSASLTEVMGSDISGAGKRGTRGSYMGRGGTSGEAEGRNRRPEVECI